MAKSHNARPEQSGGPIQSSESAVGVAVHSESASPLVHDVARQLFAAVWRPRSPIDAWMIAVDCYRGAEDFCRVSERISEGLTADEVIEERNAKSE